jgi:eukaryotic-like serine/threonine-protein kinase
MTISSGLSDRGRNSPLPTPTTAYFAELSATLDPGLAAVCDEALRSMAAAWHDGGKSPAEEWLHRYPQLARHEHSALQIIYEETCLREEAGEIVDVSEIYRRFPQWKDALSRLFECHRLIQGDEAATRFPEEGERLGELQLLRKLGQGAAGRVFLATQPSLSDRPLVVKLTERCGNEHLSLARLQHTHIAPLYLVQDFPERNLRAICMPYVGGASWSWFLEALKERPAAQRSGRSIVEALEATDGDMPLDPNRSAPALQFLSRSSYVHAVCWIGACLADALQYAHQRGLVHLDVKPSNVLIGSDGQPMLLDFHLAREVAPAAGKSIDRLGGTRNYMSPEQESAATALCEGRDIPAALDGRSDIYSLGVLLYESLSGRLPTTDEFESRRALRRANAAIDQGLEDILHKCLARRPAARYRDAGQLATDLRCCLADLPLQGVPNRSLRERWRKWRRRKPHGLAVAAAVSAALVVAAFSGLSFRSERLNAARNSLNLGAQSIAKKEFSIAAEQLENGRDAMRWIPGQDDLKTDLQNQLAAARQGRLAAAVHELVKQLRFLDGMHAAPLKQLQQLDAGCAALWEARDRIVELGGLTPGSPGQPELSSDLTDLAISWAALRSRMSSSHGGEELRRDARRLFDEAQSLCGTSFALDLARREHAIDGAASGSPKNPDRLPRPETARDHDAMGRYLFRSNKLTEAAEQFERAIELDPQAFWSYFYLTLCAYRLEDFDRAFNAASICVALSPESAPCFYNRALCQQALGQTQRSLADLNHALQVDPTMSVAWLRRGMTRAELKQYSEAMSDFGKALEHGSNPAETYYQMALVDMARDDREAALRRVRLALAQDAHYSPALDLEKRLAPQPGADDPMESPPM